MSKPQRTCIGCRKIYDQELLQRVTFDGNELSIDENGKRKDGRGCYLCRNDKCLEIAIKKRAFSRALKAEVTNEHIGRCFNDR